MLGGAGFLPSTVGLVPAGSIPNVLCEAPRLA